MKSVRMLKWNLRNSVTSLVVFYGVLLAIYTLSSVILSVGGNQVHVNGFDFATLVMLLTLGIVLFGQSLRFGLAAGVSRRSVYVGFLFFDLAVSLITMGGNLLLNLGVPPFSNVLMTLYGSGAYWSVAASNLCLNLMACLVGYCIGGAYYRMGKVLRIGVSISVPAVLVFILPIGLMSAPEAVQQAVFSVFERLFAFLGASPLNLAVCSLAVAALLALASYLFIRRAPVKAAF
ncbi:MAG: hypothetical protein ACOYJA_12385 [Christensenellales bacterium]|jgi:hypothetical protein